jgi:hypothetical protein
MKNRVELRDYIRYQLTQLGARNAQYEFEFMCFELARCRHVSNIRLQTGPVAAGGDQGRDFESYRTYLAGTSIARSTFVTMATNDMVVGACTLNKETVRKIQDDLRTIFGAGERPNHILYFCEPNLPVAKRHELQRYCKDTYGGTLEIFDGYAIADTLADPDTFWIAEQYLSVPADFYPAEQHDTHYSERRSRWLNQTSKAHNYGDFLDIKIGLRTAAREEAAKTDLLGWLDRMRQFASTDTPGRLRQKARYEIAVAELRGRGNLDPALPYVAAFFDDLTTSPERPSDLLDAAVLAIYCWGALGHGQTSMPRATVRAYVERTGRAVESAIEETTRRGDRCMLLEARSMLAILPRSATETKDTILRRSLDAWRDVVRAAEELPFFPTAHIADLVEMLAPIVGDHDGFRGLRNDIDRITEQRAGSHEVADRSWRRALAHFQAGNRLAAIDELQRAKVGSFTGDEMVSSVLAMLALSECYTELGLHIAARYYAAGATYIALHSEDEDIHRLLPKAGFSLAQTFYGGGECTTFILTLRQLLGVHLSVSQDPLNFDKYPELQRVIVHAGVFRAVADRMAPHVKDTIDKAVANWPLEKSEVDDLLQLATAPDSPWTTMTLPEIENAIERDLGHSPFLDIGEQREISWSALGIQWTVRCSADRCTLLAALELLATLQIALVELADAELLLIPTSALILVKTGRVIRPELEQLPDNECIVWQATLPSEQSDSADFSSSFWENIGVAIAIVGQATALSFDAFQAIINQSFERGLALRAFSVRPARELLEFALVQAEGVDDLAKLEPVKLSRSIKLPEPAELSWRSTPGPGYSPEKAREFLANRYRRSSEIIQLTLPRLLADGRVRDLLLDFKRRGFLEWQILSMLASIVAQYQVETAVGRPLGPDMNSRFMERTSRAELPEDPPFDLTLIDGPRLEAQAAVLAASAFQTWDLVLNRRTPDLIGMKQLLDARYRHSTDDIEHIPLLGPE